MLSFRSLFYCGALLILVAGMSASGDEVLNQNILANGDFSLSGPSGWSVGLGAFGRANSNPVFNGGEYFYNSKVAEPVCWIYQDFDLDALGYDDHRLATGGYRVTVSGYQNSRHRTDPAWVGVNDSGEIRLVEKDNSGANVRTTNLPSVIGDGTDGGWVSRSDSFRLDPDTTQLRYRFTATRLATGTNHAFLADASLKISPYKIWTHGDVDTNHAGMGNWTLDSLYRVGNTANGQVNVSQGAIWTTNEYVRLGETDGVRGVVNVDGGTWNTSRSNFSIVVPTMIGFHGNGTVNVSNSGMWTTSAKVDLSSGSDAKGVVNLDGGTWRAIADATVGWGGRGTVNVTNGGTFRTDASAFIGLTGNSEGEVAITNGTWTANGPVRLGYSGSGTVNIDTDGDWTTHDSVRLGGEFDGDGVVNVRGGRWESLGHTVVGDRSNAEVNITDGEMIVKNQKLYISSNGTLNVKGGAATLDTGLDNHGEVNLQGGIMRLKNGLDNSGTINFTGGTLQIVSGVITGLPNVCGGTLELGAGTGETEIDSLTVVNGGRLRMDGASLRVSSGMLNVGDGALEFTDTGGSVILAGSNLIHTQNQLDLAGGSLRGYGEVFVGSEGLNLGAVGNEGELSGNASQGGLIIYGDVTGTGTLSNATIHGDVSVGNSPGAITADGVQLSDRGRLMMEIGGLGAGTEYDCILIDGLLSLAGDLHVEWFGDYQAALADRFMLLANNGGLIEGTFEEVVLPGFNDPTLTWDTSELYTSGTIQVVPEPTSLCLLMLGAMAILKKRS